ncbi:methyl-accepting chemotaxis protein [Paucibacter soli]|uniref:methyl-accepting chemotaxis protein n=1 Tax=Paucibacter soli TaxID=3133433 RepID=UPI0030A4F7D7
MLSFENLRVGVRLAMGFGTVMVLLIVISVLGALGAREIAASTSQIYEDRTVPLQQLARVNSLMLQNRVLVTEMMQAPGKLDELNAVLQGNIEQVSKAWKAYADSGMTPEEARLAAKFVEMRGRYVKDGLLAARDAVKAGAAEQSGQIYANQIVPLGKQTQEAMDALQGLQVSEGAKDYAAAQRGSSKVMWVSLLGTLLAIAMGSSLAWAVSRSITAPVREALELAERVAAGDLSATLQAQGRNEMAQLLQALGRMTESLRAIVGQVRDSSESISTGSAEIATGNADLSQRTETQASNLEETAATMEQLSSTVRNNAQTAVQANELAHSASAAAGRGGAVVGDLVSNMAAISQSSNRIAEIIGVIDGIAFQTNILALNAAVEAARAGEQGRGFAVVAGEVRSLAQRSAEAAREIKSLIGDSQSKVENGNRLAEQAGGAMQDIVQEVGRVSTLIAEIANASGEQSRGIAQVGAAVGQLDQVTQQNAALVEQSAAAAESLRNQAQQLAELVASFRLR